MQKKLAVVQLPVFMFYLRQSEALISSDTFHT